MFLLFLSLGIAYRPIKKAVPTRFVNTYNSVACDTCKYIIDYIKRLLDDQTVESEIADLLEQICKTFPTPYDTLCQAYTDEYLSTVIEWLEQGLNSTEICTNLILCTSSKPIKKLTRKITILKKYRNELECDMCTHIVDYIKYVQNNVAEEESETKTLVNQICLTFKSPYNTLCNKLVEQNLPDILNLIKNGIKSLEICSNVGFCKKMTPKCNSCQSWFKWASSKSHSASVVEIWKLVSEECPKIPHLKYFCQTLNEQNIETFVSLIHSQFPPEKCCEWVNAC